MPTSLATARYERLVELLVEARRAAGLLQSELGERMGRPQSFVSKYERRERRLDVVEFVEVTEALGCQAEHIVATLKEVEPKG